MNPADLPDPALTEAEPAPAAAARRRATLAALFGLAAVGGPAMAQMGGGGGGGGAHGMRQPPATPRPDSDAKEPKADAQPPRDIVSAFARRLHEGAPELTLSATQQPAFGDFVDSLTEVGEHNERRLQRILWRSASTVSAVAPLKTYIGAEVDEGQGRQDALADLKAAYDKLDAQLDERQRAVLGNLFVATRSDLQASRDR